MSGLVGCRGRKAQLQFRTCIDFAPNSQLTFDKCAPFVHAMQSRSPKGERKSSKRISSKRYSPATVPIQR